MGSGRLILLPIDGNRRIQAEGPGSIGSVRRVRAGRQLRARRPGSRGGQRVLGGSDLRPVVVSMTNDKPATSDGTIMRHLLTLDSGLRVDNRPLAPAERSVRREGVDDTSKFEEHLSGISVTLFERGLDVIECGPEERAGGVVSFAARRGQFETVGAAVRWIGDAPDVSTTFETLDVARNSRRRSCHPVGQLRGRHG